MSLFDKDIVTKDPSWVECGRDWMLKCIQIVVDDFIKDPSIHYDHYEGISEAGEIAHIVRSNWVDNRSELKRFNIDATSTTVSPSITRGYKYDVVVKVRFDGVDDPEDYVEFIRVPIIKL